VKEMDETELQSLLTLSKDVARSACQLLLKEQGQRLKEHAYSKELPREIKATADSILEKQILNRLLSVGLPVLSEERGEIAGSTNSLWRFVVDPLDGTANFVRDLGLSSAVSIGLYHEMTPVFGVLAVYPSGDIVWGGKGFGAYLNNRPLRVSNISKLSQSVLCTGFPANFNFEDEQYVSSFLKLIKNCGKIRMIGAASLSLLNVAKGSAELYIEQDIMHWDVAAGLAIVEGAGGTISVLKGSVANSLNVVASNGLIEVPFL
jgi:myo-inositol-1(or 4)-monophosphatase